MSRLSLRGRVTLASALVLALGLAVLTVGVNLLLDHQLKTDASSVLRERAELERASVALRATEPDEGTWLYERGVVVRRPAAPADVQRVADALGAATRPVERSLDERVRLRAEPVGRGRTVVVALSLRPYERTEHTALLGALLLDAFVLAAGALLARRAVGNALRPVGEMTERAAEWSEHDLDRRFNLGPPRDELTGLSATLDALLGRIAASLRREQRLSAEMAHELRTPLSGVRGEAELALQNPALSSETRAGLEEILRGTERMEGVISTLLTAARSDVAPGASDAAGDAQRAVEVARAGAARAGVALQLRAPRATWHVAAEGDLVVQALQPLLDNAVRHAGSQVTLALARNGGAVAFAVSDDGDGLDGADIDALFEPGTSTEGGAGLGLPLARRLARSCGGDVVAVPVSAGARFELRLPAVGATS